MPKKMKARTGRQAFKPIQVYVGPDSATMWAEVQRIVAEQQKQDKSYSVSRFINEAVQARLRVK